MTKKQIIGLIMATTGKSVAEVAAEYNYNRVTFYRAIREPKTSLPIRKIISGIVGKPISDLWPEKE